MDGFAILDWLRNSDDDIREEAFGMMDIEFILDDFTNEEITEGITLYEDALKAKERLQEKRDAFLKRCADNRHARIKENNE